jgi:hypothetical protein
MGGTSSKANPVTINEQTYVNRNFLNVFTNNSNKAIANALIKNNSSCTTSNSINQLISFRGCKFTGDINISNVKQEAQITVNFNCLNAFTAQNEMAQSLLTSLMTDLKSQLDAKSVNDVNTLAEAKSKASGLPLSNVRTEVSPTSKYKLTSVNETHVAIEQIISNEIQANFNVESIQECISQSAARQEIDFANCQAANLTLKDLEQIAGITAVVECVNNSGTVQKVINSVVDKLGLKVENDSDIASDNVVKNDLKATSENIGLAFGNCCDCNFSSLCVCFVLIAIILLGAYYRLKKK